MKVHNDESVVNIRSLQKGPAEKTSTEKSRPKSSPDADQVKLSPKAQKFQRIKDSLEAVPETRQEKIAELRNAIENGTYQADTDKTAENLIKESLLDLLS